MISAYLETFAGLPVTDFATSGTDACDLPPADAVAWRLACGWDDDLPFDKLWRNFLETVPADRVRAIVIGSWWGEGGYESVQPVIDRLTESAERLPALRSIFLGDVTAEECELSWLEMTDVTPVVEAYPLLEEFVARGCGYGAPDEALAFRPVRHERLRTLRFESGGLPASIVRAVCDSELPRLERLALWLGVDQYGGDATIADLAPLLAGGRFPELRHLGLQNSEMQDEIAAAVAAAPVVAQLASLDLSMGTLTDAGAEALLEGQPLTHLTALDLHHHYLSEKLAQRVREALEPSGVEVDLSEQQQPHRWAGDESDEEHRYVAVSE
ncbi:MULTISPECIES: STM4015 family protein [Streptomyces]|uniref:STM4015 family protein n=1 Tax=Streptomyces lonegramiae TaxID=3075524 RepID=A0ABU2XGY1_9ACTN|nr:STM4015 family protein [Streptomyces sp. DSM 41529]MDT0545180.1 STM4015 family protein [Streptomyces sp. DSM 41529]